MLTIHSTNEEKAVWKPSLLIIAMITEILVTYFVNDLNRFPPIKTLLFFSENIIINILKKGIVNSRYIQA